MKIKTKKCAITLSIASIALSSALCFSHGGVAAYAEETSVEQVSNLVACENTLITVDNEIETIVDGYNDTFPENNWAATAVEFKSTVYLIEDNKYGLYIDLDADNGYLVMTTDNKIYGLETSGDLDYLRETDNIYYSYIDGFMYVDENKQFQKYGFTHDGLYDNAIAHNNTYINNTNICYAYHPIYPDLSFDGKILPSNLNAHINNYYPGFVLNDSSTSMESSFHCSNHCETSYYQKDYSKTLTDSQKLNAYENNYELNAIYNVMRDWGHRNFIHLDYNVTDDLRFQIYDDPLFSKYGKKTTKGSDNIGTYYWKANDDSVLSVMPVLYSNIRSYAIKNKYDVNSYSKDKFKSTMEYVANKLYGNNLGVEKTSTTDIIKTKLWCHRSCIVNIVGSKTYGNRDVAALGYYEYLKETPIVSDYKYCEYKLFYLVSDGDSNSPCIFDPNTSASPQLTFYYMARC